MLLDDARHIYHNVVTRTECPGKLDCRAGLCLHAVDPHTLFWIELPVSATDILKKEKIGSKNWNTQEPKLPISSFRAGRARADIRVRVTGNVQLYTQE